MRVGYTLIGGAAWTGGANFLFNLLSLVSRYAPGRLTPVLFVGADTAAEGYERFRAIPHLELVVDEAFNSGRQNRSLLKSVVWGRDADLARLFKRHKVDVVFESARFFGRRLGVPAVAWIPDMQHRLLPEFFSRSGWIKRELGFQLQVLGGRRIMVSSHDSRQACERYYPATKGRIGVVHFAIEPGEAVANDAARAVADRHGLPETYFFMPNQFWRHKNHDRVLDALAILKKRGLTPVIAASGMQSDPRAPDHFPALVKKIDELGLKDQFRLLGLVPYADLAPLMDQSAAVVNASLCEGWSTTVEEAKSRGAPLIVSELNVHREQLGASATYFDPHSPEAIARAIADFVPDSPDQRAERQRAARKDASRRVEEFVSDYCDFLEYAAGAGR